MLFIDNNLNKDTICYVLLTSDESRVTDYFYIVNRKQGSTSETE